MRSSSLMANHRYVRLWGSVTASNLGDGIVLAAAPLAAAALTRDPLLVAGVVVAQRVPWVLFSLVAGVLVDTLDRRRLLAAANLLRAAGMVLLAVSFAAGLTHISLLYLAMFCMGTAETVADNASLALVPAVVERPSLERANGRIFAAMPVANELVGPPIGGLLFAAASTIAFAAAAGSYVLGAGLALAILGRYVAQERSQDAAFGRALIEGVRWFVGHLIVRTTALWAGFFNFFGGATTGVLVLYAQERLGLSGPAFGLLLACGAVGGIIGGWLADRLVERAGPGTALQGANLVTALAYAGMALTTSPVIAAAMLAAMSLATMIANVVAYTMRQTVIPNHLLGRVTSAYRFVGLGALPLGGVIGGLLARAYGLVAPFWLAAAGLLLLGLAVAPVLTNGRVQAAELPSE